MQLSGKNNMSSNVNMPSYMWSAASLFHSVQWHSDFTDIGQTSELFATTMKQFTEIRQMDLNTLSDY